MPIDPPAARPQLLVSVRSVAEACEALAGGADVIDLKEPARGPLGWTDPALWAAVRAALAPDVPLSVALGEVTDWEPGGDAPAVGGTPFQGLTYRKLGLAGLGPDAGWPVRWRRVRQRLGPGPGWIAVIYADWQRARAPTPWQVVTEALACNEVVGVLVDTWDKQTAAPDLSGADWAGWLAPVQRSGRRLALAGRLDAAALARPRGFRPDLFAVRGAACQAGDRRGAVARDQVAALVAAVRALPGQPPA